MKRRLCCSVIVLVLLGAPSIILGARTRAEYKYPAAATTDFQSILASQQASVDDSFRKRQRHLNSVAVVASINVMINWLRPDPFVSWQMRLPRMCWELCIWFVAISAKDAPSIFLLLLSVMTATTALIDIFLWGPLFASFASFETCSGGWFSGKPRTCALDYGKGLGRLVASFQSIFGGLFYLMTAVITWNDYLAIRQEQTNKQQIATLFQAWHMHQQSPLPSSTGKPDTLL